METSGPRTPGPVPDLPKEPDTPVEHRQPLGSAVTTPSFLTPRPPVTLQHLLTGLRGTESLAGY